jgi:hypothetical protein
MNTFYFKYLDFYGVLRLYADRQDAGRRVADFHVVNPSICRPYKLPNRQIVGVIKCRPSKMSTNAPNVDLSLPRFPLCAVPLK